MILAIIILLIAVLVLAVISMIWDMRTVKKLESGMRTLNKRIKDLEKKGKSMTTVEYPAEVDDEKVDEKPEEENDSTPATQDDGEI